jgi:hypothetical protein
MSCSVAGRGHAQKIAERVTDAGVPLCVIVPPFNLADWRSEGTALVPVLSEEQMRVGSSSTNKLARHLRCSGRNWLRR